MPRQPLGDNTVHIGGDEFVANAGVVEYGGPAQGSVGVNSDGSRGWGLTYDRDPGSPTVRSLQVDPINPEINYSGNYDPDLADRWKGNLGREGHAGFPEGAGFWFPED